MHRWANQGPPLTLSQLFPRYCQALSCCLLVLMNTGHEAGENQILFLVLLFTAHGTLGREACFHRAVLSPPQCGRDLEGWSLLFCFLQHWGLNRGALGVLGLQSTPQLRSQPLADG